MNTDDLTLEKLYGIAEPAEKQVLDNLLIRLGLCWRCIECQHLNEDTRHWCGECANRRADKSPDGDAIAYRVETLVHEFPGFMDDGEIDAGDFLQRFIDLGLVPGR